MREVWASIREFCRKVARRWYAWVVGVVGGVLGVVDAVAAAAAKPGTAPFSIPLWLWLPLLAGGFLVAIVWAFHDVRMERDAARDEVERRFNAMRYGFEPMGISGRMLRNAEGSLYSVVISVDVTNSSDEHMRYEFERASVSVDNGGSNDQGSSAGPLILGPDETRTFLCASAPAPAGAPLSGSLGLTVRYGYPSVPPRYRRSWEFDLHGSGIGGSAEVGATLVRSTDVENISGPAAWGELETH